jgi:hypothetical protein
MLRETIILAREDQVNNSISKKILNLRMTPTYREILPLTRMRHQLTALK